MKDATIECGGAVSRARAGAMAAEITSKDKQLVREVWGKYVEKNYLAVGNLLFKEMFTTYPNYTKYFDSLKAPDQDVFESARFKRHITALLFPSITKMLSYLDEPERLEEHLRGIGVSHKERGLRREHFENLQPLIIATFKKALPAEFTPEIEAAFNKILSVAMAKIASYTET